MVSSEASVSYCLETEGSVLELTSSGLSPSGMLILVLAAKDLMGKAVVKAGLMQVWIEMRDAKDVRVRLVVNIARVYEGNCEVSFLCT